MQLGRDGGWLHSAAMSKRFVLRPDPAGFSVVDLWSGEPAVIAMTAQSGLSELDADHTAELLNRRQTAQGGNALQVG
jgi:hypothetical protein